MSLGVMNVARSNRFAIGLDLGKKVDYTVLTISTFSLQDGVIVRKIERLPLGTTYPKIVSYVVDIMKVLRQKGEIVSFYWDGTGPGETFTDFMLKALQEARLDDFPSAPIILTGGVKGTKLEIISNMRFLFETKQLHFEYPASDTGRREIDALIDEMRNYEDRRSSPSGDDVSLGVFKTGKHDDMVTSCAFSAKDFLITMKGGEAYVGAIPDNSWVKSPLDGGSEESFGVAVTPRF